MTDCVVVVALRENADMADDNDSSIFSISFSFLLNLALFILLQGEQLKGKTHKWAIKGP